MVLPSDIPWLTLQYYFIISHNHKPTSNPLNRPETDLSEEKNLKQPSQNNNTEFLDSRKDPVKIIDVQVTVSAAADTSAIDSWEFDLDPWRRKTHLSIRVRSRGRWGPPVTSRSGGGVLACSSGVIAAVDASRMINGCCNSSSYC